MVESRILHVIMHWGNSGTGLISVCAVREGTVIGPVITQGSHAGTEIPIGGSHQLADAFTIMIKCLRELNGSKTFVVRIILGAGTGPVDLRSGVADVNKQAVTAAGGVAITVTGPRCRGSTVFSKSQISRRGGLTAGVAGPSRWCSSAHPDQPPGHCYHKPDSGFH